MDAITLRIDPVDSHQRDTMIICTLINLTVCLLPTHILPTGPSEAACLLSSQILMVQSFLPPLIHQEEKAVRMTIQRPSRRPALVGTLRCV